MNRYKSLEEFLEALGFRESSGNYSSVNSIQPLLTEEEWLKRLRRQRMGL